MEIVMSNVVIYEAQGSVEGSVWEDILCTSGNAPHCTIEVGTKNSLERGTDGWCDVTIAVDWMKRQQVKRILSVVARGPITLIEV